MPCVSMPVVVCARRFRISDEEYEEEGLDSNEPIATLLSAWWNIDLLQISYEDLQGCLEKSIILLCTHKSRG